MKIQKYNADGDVVKVVDIPLKLAQREKFYLWLHDRKHEQHLPIMAATMSNISLDPQRIGNKTHQTFFSMATSGTSGMKYGSHFIPVPYNVSYELIIAAQYTVEMDQILEQILPFFDPAIFFRVEIPEINNTFNVKLVLDSCTPENPNVDEWKVLQWTLGFTAQTYLLKPATMNTSAISTIGLRAAHFNALTTAKLIEYEADLE